MGKKGFEVEYEIPPEMQWAGPLVTLVQRVKDPDCGERVIKTKMQAFFAADEALNGIMNGRTVISSHIEFDGLFDWWGGSF